MTYKILILGDGNFSFTLALLQQFQSSLVKEFLHLPSNFTEKVKITATSFDSREEILEKYQDSKDIFKKLDGWKDFQVELLVKHGVNAWKLDEMPEKYHVILWNHPHLGTEDFKLHRFLLNHFFHSAQGQLEDGPSQILVTLLSTQSHLWLPAVQAERQGLKVQSMDTFREEDWINYVPVRNVSRKSFKNAKVRLNTRSRPGNEVEGTEALQHELYSLVWRFTKKDVEDTWYETNFREMHLNVLNGTGDEGEEEERVMDGESTTEVIPKDTIIPDRKPHENPKKLSRKLQAQLTKGLQCPHCPSNQFNSLRGLNAHVKACHTGDTQFIPLQHAPKEPCRFYGKDGCKKMLKVGDEEAKLLHETSIHSQVNFQELGIETTPARPEMINDYIPCPTCGQAMMNQDWGMEMHLEQLKPLVGQNMTCPGRNDEGQCGKKFLESRALIQHWKLCRTRWSK